MEMIESILRSLPAVLQTGYATCREKLSYVNGALSIKGSAETTEALIKLKRILQMSMITEGVAKTTPAAKAKSATIVKDKVVAKTTPTVKDKVAAKVAPVVKGKVVTKAAPKAVTKGGADDLSITVLVSENPKRQGSASFDRFALYTKHKTVSKFLAAGGTSADLRYDEDKKFIKLS